MEKYEIPDFDVAIGDKAARVLKNQTSLYVNGK